MFKLSIIVPVYNTEKYLRKCLDSLVNQTLEDIEIIVINDSTPDNSQKIIDEFMNKYPAKIYSYIKPNGGLSDTRNFGIAKASGEFITFVDSDDWCDTNLYTKMYVKAQVDNSDVVCCNFIEKYGTYDNLRNVTPIVNHNNRYLGNVVACNKIFRRKFWLNNNFQFKLGIYHEDIELLPRVLSLANQVSYIANAFYYYNKVNQVSITYGDKLHILHFPEIFKSLDIWFHNKLSGNDYQFKVLVADFAYLYLMLNSDQDQARNFFIEYSEYFTYNLLLNKKRCLMIFMLKLNFSLFHKLNLFLKRLK